MRVSINGGRGDLKVTQCENDPTEEWMIQYVSESGDSAQMTRASYSREAAVIQAARMALEDGSNFEDDGHAIR